MKFHFGSASLLWFLLASVYTIGEIWFHVSFLQKIQEQALLHKDFFDNTTLIAQQFMEQHRSVMIVVLISQFLFFIFIALSFRNKIKTLFSTALLFIKLGLYWIILSVIYHYIFHDWILKQFILSSAKTDLLHSILDNSFQYYKLHKGYIWILVLLVQFSMPIMVYYFIRDLEKKTH